MGWFRRLLENVSPLEPLTEAPVPVGQPTDLCEAEWRQLIEVNRIHAYQTGLAEGELRGRLGLAKEIEAAFKHEMTLDDATRIRQRQVH